MLVVGDGFRPRGSTVGASCVIQVTTGAVYAACTATGVTVNIHTHCVLVKLDNFLVGFINMPPSDALYTHANNEGWDY